MRATEPLGWDPASAHDPLSFYERKVLVIGGTAGVGNVVAQAFRVRGAEVHVWGRRPKASDYPKKEGTDLDGLKYAQVDVTNFDELRQFNAAFDRLDILVLAQGTILYKRAEFAVDGFRHVVNVNLNSLMACSTKFHNMLAASGGSIIIINSANSLYATSANPAYSASKSGALSLTRTLGQVWAPEGIRVNGIAPGVFSSKRINRDIDNWANVRKLAGKIPLGRRGKNEEIASVALFLASPLASYIVGQTIIVDGGQTLSM